MDEKELRKFRQTKGYLTIKEVCDMFNCGRDYIDYGINTRKLKYMSPNNKTRFIYLDDFIGYMKTCPKIPGGAR